MKHGIAAMGLALVCLASTAARAAETAALDAQELGAAARRVESSAQFEKAAARKSDQRLYLVAAARYGGGLDEPENPGAPEILELVYYKYEGGVTLRATLDARQGTVLEVQALAAYPAPLAREERAEAVRLARDRDPSARALFAASKPEEIEVELLAPVVSDSADARYGHRLALLTLYRKTGGGPGVMLEIDLTRGSVRRLGGDDGARAPQERP
jgi:hypothetical protein